MQAPSLHDDGETVTLDLHGATVDEALLLSRETVYLAAERGRAAVKLIHGRSTSNSDNRKRTIKRALQEALDLGDFGSAVRSARREHGALTLALDLTATRDPTPIRLSDLP